jgi:hypothetical protein
VAAQYDTLIFGVAERSDDPADLTLFGSLDRGGVNILAVTGPHAGAPDAVKTAYLALPHVTLLVLLEGWEEQPAAVVLAQMAYTLGVQVRSVSKGTVKPLAWEAVTATLIPGQGVIAPDSDASEEPHEEAARIVLGPRGAYYDSPLRNFDRTGLIWSGILEEKLREGQLISAEDVALCMVGVKLARQAFRHKRDNIVDAHGYLMTIGMIRQERADREAASGDQAQTP